MQQSSVKIYFCFPEISHPVKHKQKFVDLTMSEMCKNDVIKYSGFLKENDFKKSISYHIGNKNIDRYKSLSENKKNNIKKTIHTTIKKCHRALPHPDLPIFVFIHPWFPDEKNDVLFGGITAMATYYTVHLFINLNSYTKKSLEETIAHEWNHLVFYRYHDEHQLTLRSHITMEGLAEIFREKVVGGKPAPWSLALTEKQSISQLKSLKKYLNVKSIKLYKDVFFGSRKYKRWTGYAIGYIMIKKFIKNHSKLSWRKIIMINSENILKV